MHLFFHVNASGKCSQRNPMAIFSSCEASYVFTVQDSKAKLPYFKSKVRKMIIIQIVYKTKLVVFINISVELDSLLSMAG